MHLERLRRALHVFWRVSRGQLLEVQVLLLDPSRSVFLSPSGDGAAWEFPAAALTPGETAIEAARRAVAAAGFGALPNDLAIATTTVLVILAYRAGRREEALRLSRDRCGGPIRPIAAATWRR